MFRQSYEFAELQIILTLQTTTYYNTRLHLWLELGSGILPVEQDLYQKRASLIP
jgi:hypothetical protein